jgi:hypothetical protein
MKAFDAGVLLLRTIEGGGVCEIVLCCVNGQARERCLLRDVGSDPLSNGQAVLHSPRSGYSNETNTLLTLPLFIIFFIDICY